MIDLVLIVILSVFIVYKLRSILGDEYEHDSDLRQTTGERSSAAQSQARAKYKKIIDVIPFKRQEQSVATQIDPSDTDLVANLDQDSAISYNTLRERDPDFTISQFVENARDAFECIIDGFSHGNKELLKELLSPNMYENINAEIEAQTAKGVKSRSFLVSIDSAKVLSINVADNNTAIIGVEFASKQINYLENDKGDVVEGNKKTNNFVKEMWFFQKDLINIDPTWKLINVVAQ